MPTDRRVPQPDADFLAYINVTSSHLKKPFRDQLTGTLDAGLTVSLRTEDVWPPYTKITFANTSAAGGPDLHFCFTQEDDEACSTEDSVTVEAASATEVTVKQIPGYRRHLQVTNAHATDSGSYRVTFEPNWQRLGLQEDVKNDWLDFQGRYIDNYTKYVDVNTRTKPVVQQKNTIKSDFTAFAESPLKVMEGSPNLIDEDRTACNLPERDRTPTARAPITTEPTTRLDVLAGTRVQFTWRVASDSTRASMHPDCDDVETRYAILDHSAPPPATPEDCPSVFLASSAIFTKAFGSENSGKRLHTFSRWRNKSDAAKSGPYGLRMSVVLGD